MTATATLHAESISGAQLRELLETDRSLRILDVRTGGEFESAHLPGSYNVPLDTLSEHVDELAAIDHPVVLVCQTGGRATQAHGALRTAGKHGLYILSGGIAEWERSGGDLVRQESPRWAMDRQVRLVAGSIVLASIVASLAVPRAKWLAGGVGAGLTYSAVSNTCTMANLLARLPYNRTDPCDIPAVIEEINRAAA